MKYIADIYVRYYNKKYGRIGHLLQDAIARCQAKTTLKSYWHELRDHQEYRKKIAMKTGTHTQVHVPMTNGESRCREGVNIPIRKSIQPHFQQLDALVF